MKRVLLLLLCSVLMAGLIGAQALAAPSPQDEAFTITSYDVHVNVSMFNEFDITEVIAVHFNEPQRIIGIPLEDLIHRRAGSKLSSITACYSDVNVEGRKFDVSLYAFDSVIRIGDARTIMEGDQTYRISYRMGITNYDMTVYDEFRYNLINAKWDTTIEKVMFSVTLPQEFDISQASFSVGSEGSPGDDPQALAFTVKGNTITGKTTKPLDNNKVLTMSLKLPKGYTGLPVENPPMLQLSIPAVLFALCAIIGLAALIRFIIKLCRHRASLQVIAPYGYNDPTLFTIHKNTNMPTFIWSFTRRKKDGSDEGSK